MILAFLENLPDHRRAQGRRYELKYIVLFSIMGILSNAKSYRDIERFISKHFKKLSDEFGLDWKRPPGYTTVRNILKGMDPDGVERCFRDYSRSLERQPLEGLVPVAVDGKVLRKSFDNFNDQSAIQMLSFFESGSNIILAHERIDSKTNEIPVARRLIEELELGDVVFTLDALHCQKALFEAAEQDEKKKKNFLSK